MTTSDKTTIFLQLVRDMREAQKKFYANRREAYRKPLLEHAKELEKQVDTMLAEIFEPGLF